MLMPIVASLICPACGVTYSPSFDACPLCGEEIWAARLVREVSRLCDAHNANVGRDT